MRFEELAKQARRLLTDNAPLILTAIGVTGTVTVAYLTGRATFKAAELISDEEKMRCGDTSRDLYELELKEKVELVWKLYIPAAGTAALTVTAIILANRIGTRRAAAVAAAFSISERAFDEYRTKVVERIGEKKEQSYRDEIAQDRLNRNPVGNREIIITGNGDSLCYDSYTGRYFQSSMEKLLRAEVDINQQILNDHYASLNDFYYNIGLSPTEVGSEVGWNLDKFLKLDVTVGISDDQRPCLAMMFEVSPAGKFFRNL